MRDSSEKRAFTSFGKAKVNTWSSCARRTAEGGCRYINQHQEQEQQQQQRQGQRTGVSAPHSLLHMVEPHARLEGEVGFLVEPAVLVADYYAVGPLRDRVDQKAEAGGVLGELEFELRGIGVGGVRS